MKIRDIKRRALVLLARTWWATSTRAQTSPRLRHNRRAPGVVFTTWNVLGPRPLHECAEVRRDSFRQLREMRAETERLRLWCEARRVYPSPEDQGAPMGGPDRSNRDHLRGDA